MDKKEINEAIEYYNKTKEEEDVLVFTPEQYEIALKVVGLK